MPLRPNYRRDRLERDPAARGRTAEKQEKEIALVRGERNTQGR